MTAELPLAAASARLRRRPGRPAKAGPRRAAPAMPASAPHRPPLLARRRAEPAGRPLPELEAAEAAYARPSGVAPLAPRLLDLDTTAAYLGCSPWTVRDLEAGGVLPRIRVPLPKGGELRKLLFDREDLDRLITVWKERAQP